MYEEELKNLRQRVKGLGNDLLTSNEKLVDVTKTNLNLEKQREKVSSEANQWHAKNHRLLKSVNVLKLEKDDLGHTITEERQKLKSQQTLYESIRAERNLFCQQLNEAQDEIAEMKRKFKIMSHQIEQYKEETQNKDKALIKQHFEIKELSEQCKAFEKQKMKKDDILQQADRLLLAQDGEIKTLRRTLAEAEAVRVSVCRFYVCGCACKEVAGLCVCCACIMLLQLQTSFFTFCQTNISKCSKKYTHTKTKQHKKKYQKKSTKHTFFLDSKNSKTSV